MRLFKNLLLLCFVFIPSLAFAEPAYNADLSLTSIKRIGAGEKPDEELYMNIFSIDDGKKQIARIPEYPLHWLEKYLHEIKNVALWNGSFRDGDDIHLQVELADTEDFPLLTDDLLGAATVELHHTKARGLEGGWGHFKEPIHLRKLTTGVYPIKIELDSRRGIYVLNLKLTLSQKRK